MRMEGHTKVPKMIIIHTLDCMIRYVLQCTRIYMCTCAIINVVMPLNYYYYKYIFVCVCVCVNFFTSERDKEG